MGERREWTVLSDVQAITPIVETVQGLCAAAGFSARHCRLNIPVAITEAMANAMMRGNDGIVERPVHVAVVLEEERLVVEVTDQGGGFDMAALATAPDASDWLEREDGRGVFLMRSLMDHVESQCVGECRGWSGGGHLLRMVLRRA